MQPAEIVKIVKESGLRGRGGAGFPTGMKWSFMKPGDGKPHYLCCNADESEPGTFKDREIMRWTPHALVEGCAIGAYAIGAETCVRLHPRRVHTEALEKMNAACKEAYAAGILGTNAMGTGKTVDVYVHKGAGAYICGEETAMMNSLEGQARQSAHQAAVPGGRRPVRPADDDQQRRDARRGAAHPQQRRRLVQEDGRADNPKSTGTKLFSVCGNIAEAGQLRSRDGLSVQGFPLRPLRRPAARPQVQGDHPRRHLGADPDAWAEAENSPMDYEGFVAQRHDARLRRRDRHRRRAEPREADRARRALLRARELRRSARSAARARRGRRRSSSASSPATARTRTSTRCSTSASR